MRRRAYSNADVTLLANRYGCVLSASAPDSATSLRTQRPTFVSPCEPTHSITDALDNDNDERESMRSADGESSSSSSGSTSKSSGSESSVSSHLPRRRSPLARSSSSSIACSDERAQAGAFVRSASSAGGDLHDDARADLLAFSIDESDTMRADLGGNNMQRRSSDSLLPSQRASIDEDALRDTIVEMSKRVAAKPQARLWRRKSKLCRILEENDPNFTVVHYCADFLCRQPPRLFRVPNDAIDAYMRTCLMRAHASSVSADPFRVCACRTAHCAHASPDVTAKFAAIYVLDAAVGARAASRFRGQLASHMQRSVLGAGAWARYEIPATTTDFNNAKHITFAYFVYGFV